jgi:hypothetical protein
MNHFISYEINTVETCPYRNLFNELFIENLKEKETFQDSNIYFITKTKKVRFNLEKTTFINKTDFKTEIILGDNEKSASCSASLYDLVNVFSHFHETKEDFEELIRCENPLIKLDYRLEDSKSDMLSLYLLVDEQEEYPIKLLPENFEVVCEVDFKNEPEILYIGQSFNMLDRIQSHKALHKSVSQIEDDEEVKVCFINFKYGYGGGKAQATINGKMWDYWLNQDRKSADYKTKIDLVERFLIHFFKPIYNNQHVNSNMIEDKRVKEILLTESISSMSVGLSVWGFGYDYWTNKQPLKSELFSFDFKNPKRGYQKGMVWSLPDKKGSG